MSTDDIKRLRALIADDAHALTFQTFGQYRTALLREIDAMGAAPSPQGDAERLDYLMRRLSGAAIRYYVGELGDTGSLDDFRTAIDTRRNHAGNAQQPASTNTGHGHVFSRPDGVRARCGGPGICAECSRDARSTPAKGGE